MRKPEDIAKWLEDRKNSVASLYAAGEYVRTAALAHNDDVVKVIFQCREEEKAYFMHRKTYHAIPLGVVATPADFARFGEITEAGNTDLYHAETPRPADGYDYLKYDDDDREEAEACTALC